MFSVFPSDEQQRAAKSLVQRHNIGQRGKADGSQQEQYYGMLGQICLCDMLRFKRPTGSEGFDGGVDFIINNIKVDLKTMHRTVDVKDHYVHNFIGYQMEYPCQFYIFASYNIKTNKLTLCGIISKKDFLKKASFYEKGAIRTRDDGTSFASKAPLYEIKQEDLIQIKNKQDMLEKVRI